MKFEDGQPIFLQILEQICWDIANGRWKAEERLPSVRDLAVELEVNPNTVLKSYAELEAMDIIYKARGMGYYVSSNAKANIARNRSDKFFRHELPKVFKVLKMLQVDPEKLHSLYKKYLTEE